MLQGRLTKDVERLHTQQQQLADKLDSLHTEIYRGNERMDQFKLVMNWNQEECTVGAGGQAEGGSGVHVVANPGRLCEILAAWTDASHQQSRALQLLASRSGGLAAESH